LLRPPRGVAEGDRRGHRAARARRSPALADGRGRAPARHDLLSAPRHAGALPRPLHRADRVRRKALMAGIGWKLQRMIDHGSLAGTIAAYLTGVAVTSGPWLLTTAGLHSLRLVSRRATGDFAGIERFLTVVYAVTVVLSAPVHVVVSRYTADRLYDRHLERIPPPLRRATALIVVGFAAIGIALVVALGLALGAA